MQAESDAFWRWFSQAASRLEADNFSDPDTLRQLDRHLFNVDSRLNWEIGPGATSPAQLVISPNFNPELVPICKSLLARAPQLPRWSFLMYKPRRPGADTVTVDDLGNEAITLDTSRWTYVILNYPDRGSEVLIAANEALPFDADSRLRWIAGALTLESLLGEQLVMELQLDWELVDALEPRFSVAARPLSALPSAFNLPPVS
jgi:hypothetical protein